MPSVCRAIPPQKGPLICPAKGALASATSNECEPLDGIGCLRRGSGMGTPTLSAGMGATLWLIMLTFVFVLGIRVARNPVVCLINDTEEILDHAIYHLRGSKELLGSC